MPHNENKVIVMRILLTAFGPFASNTSNPTEQIAGLIAAARPDIDVVILPVEYHAARRKIRELGSYDLHLALGLAADRSRATFERFAINRMDSPIPDNSGYIATDEEISAGPLAREETLGVKSLISYLRGKNYDVGESHSAGLYVCNLTMYSAIETSTHAGFLHLPPESLLGVESGADLVLDCLHILEDALC